MGKYGTNHFSLSRLFRALYLTFTILETVRPKEIFPQIDTYLFRGNHLRRSLDYTVPVLEIFDGSRYSFMKSFSLSHLNRVK